MENFQGYWRNSKCNFQGLIKELARNFQVLSRKNLVEFPGVSVIGFKIPNWCNKILWSSCFFLEGRNSTLGYYPRKNPNKGLRIWNFEGYQRNSMWNFQELIKNEVEFPRVTKKNWCRIFRGLCFWPRNFSLELRIFEIF